MDNDKLVRVSLAVLGVFAVAAFSTIGYVAYSDIKKNAPPPVAEVPAELPPPSPAEPIPSPGDSIEESTLAIVGPAAEPEANPDAPANVDQAVGLPTQHRDALIEILRTHEVTRHDLDRALSLGTTNGEVWNATPDIVQRLYTLIALCKMLPNEDGPMVVSMGEVMRLGLVQVYENGGDATPDEWLGTLFMVAEKELRSDARILKRSVYTDQRDMAARQAGRVISVEVLKHERQLQWFYVHCRVRNDSDVELSVTLQLELQDGAGKYLGAEPIHVFDLKPGASIVDKSMFTDVPNGRIETLFTIESLRGSDEDYALDVTLLGQAK